MTRKSIAKLVDALIEQTAAAHGHDITDRTGIDPITHLVNGKVFEALHRLTPDLVAATNPPAA